MSAFVLIFDGDPKRLERIRHRVEAQGPKTVTAAGAREAIAIFVRRQPDLTLIHADSPSDRGIELCRDMKRLGVGRRRPVVIVGPPATRAAAFDAGCDAFVARHLDDRSLRRLIRRFLDSARGSLRTEAIALSP